MAAGSLLALLDDIATILDDVAVTAKIAAKKTAGVLGDDLALNAEQVSGVKPQRELPVVWAVAKGSFINKLILVPSALLISLIYPPLIIVLLILGGLYLCFEGFEKVFHKVLHSSEDKHQALLNDRQNPDADLVVLEKQKIKGAIRTDFILSAEIIVIVLGTVQAKPMITQILTLSGLAIAFTAGVYGLVAAIVKLDDVGLHLARTGDKLKVAFGKFLLAFAPKLMKSLSLIGTIAMFLVGGGILMHNLGFLHHLQAVMQQSVASSLGDTHWVLVVLPTINTLVAGFVAGGLCLLLWSGLRSIFHRQS